MKADGAQVAEPTIVCYTCETLPPRTEEDRARLKALAARPESEIDMTDIPELTEKQLKNSFIGRLFRPAKPI